MRAESDLAVQLQKPAVRKIGTVNYLFFILTVEFVVTEQHRTHPGVLLLQMANGAAVPGTGWQEGSCHLDP